MSKKAELPVILLDKELLSPLVAVLHHTLLTKVGPDILCDDIVWLMALTERTAKVTRAVAHKMQGHAENESELRGELIYLTALCLNWLRRLDQ